MPANPRSKGGQEALPRGSAGSRVTARVVLAALLAALALWIGWHFLNALVWAVVVTVAAWPAYRRFVRLFAPKHRDVSAPLIFTVVLGIVVFIPLAIAIGEVAATSNLVFDTLARFRESGVPTPDWLGALPFGDHAIRWWNTNLADPANARHFLGNPDKQAQVEWTRGVGVEILQRSFMTLLSLSATFALLRSGPALGDRVLDTADKFLGDPGEQLARKMVETIRGTVNGTVVVAIAEGIVIGAGYVIAGVPPGSVVCDTHGRVRDDSARCMGRVHHGRIGAGSGRQCDGRSWSFFLRRSGHDRWRHRGVAVAGGKPGASAVSSAFDRHFWRPANLRTGGPLCRPGHHGCILDRCARMARKATAICKLMLAPLHTWREQAPGFCLQRMSNVSTCRKRRSTLSPIIS